MSDRRYQTFTDFWPFYLGEHSLPATRWMHFVGSTLALLVLASGVVAHNPWSLLAALASGYAFAWVSHFFIEKNRPATFTYPLWSFAADWKMWAFMVTGRLTAELARHGIRPRVRSGADAAS
jgi:hypothetical protein